MRNIRDVAFKNREQQELESRQSDELYKLPQFRNVQSRLYEGTPSSEGGATVDPSERQVFLTKGRSDQIRATLTEEKKAKRAELDAELAQARAQAADSNSIQRRPSVPKAEDLAVIPARNQPSNFIGLNKVKAQTMQPPRKDKSELPTRHEEYGRVPEYLEERKAKKLEEEEERRRRAPDPSCPPGMMLMSDEERLSTLEQLLASKEECNKQLGKLPFVVETPSLRRKQENLESKLNEIEKALELFNKPKVYIAIDG